MNHHSDTLNNAKDKMATDLRNVVSDGEDFLKSAAQASGAGIAMARDRLDDGLASAKTRLVDGARPVINKAKHTAVSANDYVHANPWPVLGIAVAASVLLGFLASRR